MEPYEYMRSFIFGFSQRALLLLLRDKCSDVPILWGGIKPSTQSDRHSVALDHDVQCLVSAAMLESHQITAGGSAAAAAWGMSAVCEQYVINGHMYLCLSRTEIHRYRPSLRLPPQHVGLPYPADGWGPWPHVCGQQGSHLIPGPAWHQQGPSYRKTFSIFLCAD